MKKQELSIDNIGIKGINSDVSQWSLPYEFITDGNNFRVFTNKIQSNGGYFNWSQAPVDFIPGRLMYAGGQSELWIIAGADAVYAFDGATWSDISSIIGYPAIAADANIDWTFSELGKIIIANNPSYFPEYWDPKGLGQPLQLLPFDAANTFLDMDIKCKSMRSYKGFLFALNLTESGTDFLDGYRWSTPADINGLPFTWDPEDISGLAGREALGGDSGAIIDGMSLRDTFCIYSENEINILSLSGDEFVFRRRLLSSTYNLLFKDCIIEVKGNHLFLSDGDIVMNDGNSVKSIIHNRLKKRLTANMNVENYFKSYAVRNVQQQEAWFCVTEGNSEYPNVAYIYNWNDDSWAIKDLPPDNIHSAYGRKSNTQNSWDTLAGTWDILTGTWGTIGSGEVTPLDKTLIALDESNYQLQYIDFTELGIIGNLNTYIERLNMPLEGITQVTTITRVFPRIKGSSPVSIQFGSHDYPGSPVRWKPAIVFDPSSDRKIDLRTTGELHAWKISSIGDGQFEMSGMDLEYTISGDR